MKKLSSKMKILLVLAVCTAFIVPSIVSAATTQHVNEQIWSGGKYSKTIKLQGETTLRLDYKIINGEESGKNMVSSVKLTLRNKDGKVKIVPISPDQFNKKTEFSVLAGYFDGADLASLMDEEGNVELDIKVGGQKNGSLVLTVWETYFPTTTGGYGDWK